jgi:spermidine synthase
MPSLAETGELTGTGRATLIDFTPPMILLASVGPYIIRLQARMGHVGATAGRISALSTFGSVAGILLTTFVLVPVVGTLATLKIACAATASVGIVGLVGRQRAAVIAIVPLVVLPFVRETKWSADTIWVAESPYNLVRVRQRGDTVALFLNQDNNIQTRLNERTGWSSSYRDLFALGPLLAPADRLLVLGMGGGASIISTRATAPKIQVDAVEIDPLVVEAGVRFFGLRRDDPKMTMHVADARPWLMHCRQKYDLVHVDIYQGGLYVPFYLVTEEFFHLVHDRMTDHGLLMINVLDFSEDLYLVDTMAATLDRVFETLAVILDDGGSQVVFAFPRQRSLESIRSALEAAESHPDIKAMAQYATETIRLLDPPADALVMTDDHAPIESMTRRMIAEFKARHPEP